MGLNGCMPLDGPGIRRSRFSNLYPSGRTPAAQNSMLMFFKTIGVLALGFVIGDVRVVEKRDPQGKLRLRTEVKDVGHGEPVKHGFEITYYGDGSEKSRYRYQNDVLDGPWKDLYASGKTQAEGTYRHGLKDGTETRYLSNGDKMEQTEFKDGKRHGKHIEWAEGNKKTLEATYSQDVLEGTFARWFPDEKPRFLLHYVHGEQEGLEQRCSTANGIPTESRSSKRITKRAFRMARNHSGIPISSRKAMRPISRDSFTAR